MNEVQTRTERRQHRNREAILDAAEAAFIGGGYRGARIGDIADAADVAVGSIYTHFGNKDGLYLALVERATELFARYLDEAFRDEWSPLEQVMAAGDSYLRFYLEHPGAFRFLAFDGVETRLPVVDPTLSARVTERVTTLIDGFRAKIQAAIDAGEADAGLDAHLASRFLWGAWNGAVALGLRTDGLALDRGQVEACLQHARRLVLEGLTAPSFRTAEGRSQARLLRTAGSARPAGRT
jgi:AcrR family transcriptional regulator